MSNAVPVTATAPIIYFAALCDSPHHSSSSVAPSVSRTMSSMFGGSYSSIYGGNFMNTIYHTRPSGKLIIIDSHLLPLKLMHNEKESTYS